MKIGVPKEIKHNEFRVAMTPAGVDAMVSRGHEVFIERGAGLGSGYPDDRYLKSGARLTDASDLYKQADMIYKVKEILPPEYPYMRENLIVLTYLHSNAYLKMTQELLKKKIIGIAYEDVIDESGQYPLLRPMSELAGKGGFIAGMNLMQSINGGNGLLMARTHGVRTPHVTIIGGGAAGLGAAELAISFGNQVSILDIDIDRLEKIKNQFPPNVELLYSNRNNLEICLKKTDMLINCILWEKTRSDHLVSREDLKLLQRNSIIIDVSCDEHGAIETSRSTTHDDPIYEVDGVVHYAVDNIPSAFSQTATEMLANVTLPYAMRIADLGVEEALRENEGFRRGLSFYCGQMTLLETSLKHNIPFMSPEEAIGMINKGGKDL